MELSAGGVKRQREEMNSELHDTSGTQQTPTVCSYDYIGQHPQHPQHQQHLSISHLHGGSLWQQHQQQLPQQQGQQHQQNPGKFKRRLAKVGTMMFKEDDDGISLAEDIDHNMAQQQNSRCSISSSNTPVYSSERDCVSDHEKSKQTAKIRRLSLEDPPV